MYNTCLFCNKPLGTNEAIEIFPVGRRVAFDQARGRLWVVCKACERWNLSPIEERWEVVEICEELYREARLRTATENIGLARLRDGMELVRIGAPLRPEFAAWRYGDQFGRRRRRNLLRAGLGVGAIVAVYGGLSMAGIGIASYMTFGINGIQRAINGNENEVIARVNGDGRSLEIKRRQLAHTRIIRHDTGWALDIGGTKKTGSDIVLTGSEAEQAVRVLLPAVNRFGGNRRAVSEAVSLLERSDPQHYIHDVARDNGYVSAPSLNKLPYSVRLALEMSTHEEAERRAMEGELRLLEDAWRKAEEIAAISDNLLISDSVEGRVRSMRES